MLSLLELALERAGPMKAQPLRSAFFCKIGGRERICWDLRKKSKIIPDREQGLYASISNMETITAKAVQRIMM